MRTGGPLQIGGVGGGWLKDLFNIWCGVFSF